MLLQNKGKDDSAAEDADTVTSLCNLCDLYTRNDMEGRWEELEAVYYQRCNVDNLHEILDLSAPGTRINNLKGWHLERMAVGEFESAAGTSANDLAEIKRESRMIKQTLMKILATGRSFQTKRKELEVTMTKQRDELTVELKKAKEFLGQAHLLNACDTAVLEVSEPALVEERLRAAVKRPEMYQTDGFTDVP